MERLLSLGSPQSDGEAPPGSPAAGLQWLRNWDRDTRIQGATSTGPEATAGCEGGDAGGCDEVIPLHCNQKGASRVSCGMLHPGPRQVRGVPMGVRGSLCPHLAPDGWVSLTLWAPCHRVALLRVPTGGPARGRGHWVALGDPRERTGAEGICRGFICWDQPSVALRFMRPPMRLLPCGLQQ